MVGFQRVLVQSNTKIRIYIDAFPLLSSIPLFSPSLFASASFIIIFPRLWMRIHILLVTQFRMQRNMKKVRNCKQAKPNQTQRRKIHIEVVCMCYASAHIMGNVTEKYFIFSLSTNFNDSQTNMQWYNRNTCITISRLGSLRSHGSKLTFGLAINKLAMHGIAEVEPCFLKQRTRKSNECHSARYGNYTNIAVKRAKLDGRNCLHGLLTKAKWLSSQF